MAKITLAEMLSTTGVANGAAYNKKTVRKEARVAVETEEVITVIDGVEETRNVANAGDYIITGPAGEEYVLGKAKFEKLYRHVSENVYETLPDSIRAVEVSEELLFEAPWGGDMIALPGDYIAYRSDTDAYRIERSVFVETYELA